jgi:TRAP-type C4-dicarboxylate transport system substrate-binding protein
MYKFYSQETEKLGSKMLNVIGDGFMGYGSTKPIDPKAIYDFSLKKNIQVRVPPMDLFVILVSDMGLNPTAVAYAEVYSALQTGIVDGWVGGNPESNFLAFKDVIKVYAHLQYGYEIKTTIMNVKKFDALPEEYQKIFLDEFHAVSVEHLRKKETADKGYIDKLKEAGISVYIPEAGELSRMAAYIRERSWPRFYNLYGEDVIKAIFADYANMK